MLEGKLKKEILDWTKTIAIVVVLVVSFRAVAFASFHIPTESMVPTLRVGDRIVVTKFAYGYSKHSLPFATGSFPGTNGRLFGQNPKRGDIVVFKHTREELVMIKRVIGLPGDHVQVRGGRLILNGEPVRREKVTDFVYRDPRGYEHDMQKFIEHLPGGADHTILERSDIERNDDTPVYVVPEGYLFMMGDNRDNSADSRIQSNLGLVPLENLMGRAEIISYSLSKCNQGATLKCGVERMLSRLK